MPTRGRLTALVGLTACAPVAVSTIPDEPEPFTGFEPSGLHGDEVYSVEDAEGRHFEVVDTQWCDAQLDPRERRLEVSQSFLQIWNIVDAHASPSFGPSQARPETEDQARALLCGSGAACDPAQPRVVRTDHQSRIGLGLLLPTELGFAVVPIAGGQGSCAFEPTITIESNGQLLHARVSASAGERERTYYHGLYGHYGDIPSYGTCVAQTITRTDVVIDVESDELELFVSQTRPASDANPGVELELQALGVVLSGCGQRLELSWTER